MKVFKITLIAVSLLMTIINIWNAITNKLVVNWLNLTSLAPIIIALYYEWDWLFIQANKFKSWFSNKTVSFKATIHLYFEDEDYKQEHITEKLQTAVFNFIKSKECTTNGKAEVVLPYSKLNLETKNKLKFILEITGGDHGDSIAISMNYQISARNINNCWLMFKELCETVSDRFELSRRRYDALLDYSASKQNPFYRLTIKPIDADHVNNFKLDFSENSMKIIIDNNRLYASSENVDNIHEVLSNYIPLTHVI